MIVINIDKAKTVAHEMRRAARSEEFKPLDQLIVLAIPGVDTQAVEAQRQAVRDKYAEVQFKIDTASTPDEIKAALLPKDD